MPDFSVFIPATYQNISSGHVETLLQVRQEELFTGLMRLSRSSGENLVLTFLGGVQQKLYRCFENATEAIPKQTRLDVSNHSDSSVGFLRLPVEALRFTKVVYEAPILRVDATIFSPEELRDAAGYWSMDGEPGIVHVRSEKINRFYLIAGHSSPIIEELSFGDGDARFSIGDTSFPQALPAEKYHVVRYISRREHEVWREYELRLAFNPLIHMLLNRFGELAGRMLTERLCEQLSVWAREGGWNITITGNGAVNRQYFDSLESAIGVYAELLRRFRQEASRAIGSRMVENISRETLMKLDPYRRELLTQYGVGGLAGVVLR